MKNLWILPALWVGLSPVLQAAPPEDPEKLKLYNHNKAWLAPQPGPFIATNIRGEGLQYAERRQAALDLVKEKRDFSVVSELMVELERGNFLSDQICDILGDWKARKAVPLLKKIQADPERPEIVRKRAEVALSKMIGTAIPTQQN
jgi:uncharacterized iron-regulated protein